MNLTFEIPIHSTGRGRGRRSIRSGLAPEPTPLPEGTVPRISRLMALAIHFDRFLASGAVGSMTELARKSRVTRARMTQIMNLNHLAPEIQEALLFLPRTVSGRTVLTERDLRAAASEVDWGRQGQPFGSCNLQGPPSRQQPDPPLATLNRSTPQNRAKKKP